MQLWLIHFKARFDNEYQGIYVSPRRVLETLLQEELELSDDEVDVRILGNLTEEQISAMDIDKDIIVQYSDSSTATIQLCSPSLVKEVIELVGGAIVEAAGKL